MDDEQIEKAIESILAIADANFPGNTDITISVEGKNQASIILPAYVMRGILETAKKGRAVPVVDET